MSDAAGAVLETIAANDVRSVDFRFTDLTGQWRHVGYAAGGVTAELLAEGVMFDGASVPGWRDVSESDMLLRPDLASALLDPFSAQPALILYCDVVEPGAGFDDYECDPRSTARRAQEHLAASGIADLALFAPEPEFFVFDDVRFAVAAHEGFFWVDSAEARHNGATRYENGNPGHRPAPGGGYFAANPRDALADLRAEMAAVLQGMGLGRVHHHHEAEAGQCEVGFDPEPLLRSADRMQALKYAVHNVAASYGKTATFMPMPMAEGAGLGLHVHQSLRLGDKSLFAGTGYADLSETCLHYVGGILHHARALNAFTNPTTNSYRRLVPGAATPTLLAYSARNRSAAVRIPHAAQAGGKRVEVRFADPAANPYLALAALLMAGLDGIRRRLDPGEAMDRNLYDLPPEEVDEVPRVCRSLGEALEALDADREFLVAGEVFADGLIDAYIGLKAAEAEAVARTPHPAEFELYYSV